MENMNRSTLKQHSTKARVETSLKVWVAMGK